MDNRVLGRGLSALIPAAPPERGDKVQTIEIDRLEASTFQPRIYFSDSRLKELAASIKEKGVIQPILVRAKGAKFEIIAGERRFRAAKSLGFKEIPAIIKNVDDANVLELSLIENVQREELNRIEEARAYRRLASEFNLTQEQISAKVSKDRATIANTLRLLELPEKIQRHLEENLISMGHAKSLLMLADEKEQGKLCDKILKKGLSVRQSEVAARILGAGAGGQQVRRKKDIHLASIEEKLQHRFGTRIRILQGKKRGKIVIEYFSQEDLNRVLGILGGDE
jgi:ParB family chromosome partitioning protein